MLKNKNGLSYIQNIKQSIHHITENLHLKVTRK